MHYLPNHAPGHGVLGSEYIHVASQCIPVFARNLTFSVLCTEYIAILFAGVAPTFELSCWPLRFLKLTSLNFWITFFARVRSRI